MSDLTAKFTALEEQLASEHTAIMSAIADLQTSIDLVASNTDLALENGAANTKALLAALGQTGACFPCPTPSIIVPPTNTDGVTVDSALCQRVQGFLQTIHDILSAMDTMQSYNVVGTFSVLNDAISEVIGAVSAGDTLPLPSFPETVNIVGDYISYAGERLFSGVGLVEQFDPIMPALSTAMFTAGSASAAQSSYASVIDASSVSNGAKLLFKAVAYNALWSYYFDPGSTPDVSGYDGSLCQGALIDITECTSYASEPFFSSPVTLQAIDLPPRFEGHPARIQGDFIGWSVRVVSVDGPGSVQLFRWDADMTLHFVDESVASTAAMNVSDHTAAITIQSGSGAGDGDPFVVEICPPA